MSQEEIRAVSPPPNEEIVLACGAKVVSSELQCGLDVLRKEIEHMSSDDQAIAKLAGRFNVCSIDIGDRLCPYTAFVQHDGQAAIDARPPARRWSRRSL